MATLPLFDDINVDTPNTEGIKYAGSKLKLLPHILDMVHRCKARTIFDGFSGTTRVSQALAKQGYQVIANDISAWSETFGICYLQNTKSRGDYDELFAHLNSLDGNDGWYTENYGGISNGGKAIQEDGLKKPWQTHNTRRLDAIREEIDRLALPRVEKAVAITGLILALDRVDSTLGHFVSYLKDWSPRSFNELDLRVPRLFVSQSDNDVHRNDIFNVIDDVEADVSYFDPPYGSNNDKMPPSRVRYASYYHPWTSICLNDKPELFGKARRRADSSDRKAASVFEEFRRNADTGAFLAVEAIASLIERARSRYIILSYSSGGRATAAELHEVLSKNTEILELKRIDYKRNVMADMKWTNDWTREAETTNREFLFLLEK